MSEQKYFAEFVSAFCFDVSAPKKNEGFKRWPVERALEACISLENRGCKRTRLKLALHYSTAFA